MREFCFRGLCLQETLLPIHLLVLSVPLEVFKTCCSIRGIAAHRILLLMSVWRGYEPEAAATCSRETEFFFFLLYRVFQAWFRSRNSKSCDNEGANSCCSSRRGASELVLSPDIRELPSFPKRFCQVKREPTRGVIKNSNTMIATRSELNLFLLLVRFKGKFFIVSITSKMSNDADDEENTRYRSQILLQQLLKLW